MAEQRTVVQLKEVPRTYISFIAEYTLPYTTGLIGGAFVRNGIGQATASLPRILGIGVDDVATISLGVITIMQGSKVIGKWAIPVGSGIITSWLLGKLLSGLIPTFGGSSDIQALAGFFDPERRGDTTFSGVALN